MLYSIIVHIATFFIRIVALFHRKTARFLAGRQGVFENLKEQLDTGRPVIWMHAASLGEYEQGLPVLEKLRENYPQHQILVTFFSPSGYEVTRKKNPGFLLQYLPLDSPQNASRFISLVKPSIAIFVKYEVWPNFFKCIQDNGVPLVLISARFIKSQVYFQWYGWVLRKALRRVNHFFVQDHASALLLQNLGIENISIAGDTRFDRVGAIAENAKDLDFMDQFKGSQLCFVAGSTWIEDENVLLSAINDQGHKFRTIIAPHEISTEHVRELRSRIKRKVVLYSQMSTRDFGKAEVLILDTIGLLSRIYGYADFAYIGGGFRTGLHNTLEAAVFGVPIMIGPKYSGFLEVEDLVKSGGIRVVRTAGEVGSYINSWVEKPETRHEIGEINKAYVKQKQGASVQIVGHIRKLL